MDFWASLRAFLARLAIPDVSNQLIVMEVGSLVQHCECRFVSVERFAQLLGKKFLH